MDRLRRLANNVMQGARRAESLTQRLLAFSRQQPLAPKPVDIGRLVTGMSDLMRRTLGEQITIETVLGGGVWRAQADPNQLELAILNLAVNARDAMPNGGKLTLETTNVHLDDQYSATQIEVIPGQYVMLAVTDTGTGMPEEVKGKGLRSLLHHQGRGPRHRPWAVAGLWFRQAIARPCQNLQRAGNRHDHKNLPTSGPCGV